MELKKEERELTTAFRPPTLTRSQGKAFLRNKSIL
jgi:hypothetical protein